MAYEVHNGSIFPQGIWTPAVRSAVPAGELFTQNALSNYSSRFMEPRPTLPADPVQMSVGSRSQPLRSCSMGGDVPLSPSPLGELISGVGVLTWLSSKAGLITAKGNKFTVSFQLKDFCDQGVSDLTAILRPGFTLSFQAIASESNDWIATNVSPLHGLEAEKEFFGAVEVDLEAAEASLTSGPPRLAKDMYSVELELRAIPMLLSIFQRHGLPHCQLSSLHSQISNCGDDELYRYVGTSSLKRRQYLERRTHLFVVSSGDQVCLQPASIYQAVTTLARYLLCRGGATSTQSLYEYFITCPELLMEAREIIEEGRAAFLSLILSHPWIFALFPARNFVSIRRNLPHYDYCAFLKQNFPECDLIGRRFSPPPNVLKPHMTLAGMSNAVRPLTGNAISGVLPVHSAALMLPMQSTSASANSANKLSAVAQMTSTRIVGRPPSSNNGNWSGMTSGSPFLDGLSGVSAVGNESALVSNWGITNASVPAGAAFWSHQQAVTPTNLPAKRFLVSTSTQTENITVDRACGPDQVDPSGTIGCVCGAFARNIQSLVNSKRIPSSITPVTHANDEAQGGTLDAVSAGDVPSLEDCVSGNEERLYNPFESFLPPELAATTSRFSAFKL